MLHISNKESLFPRLLWPFHDRKLLKELSSLTICAKLGTRFILTFYSWTLSICLLTWNNQSTLECVLAKQPLIADIKPRPESKLIRSITGQEVKSWILDSDSSVSHFGQARRTCMSVQRFGDNWQIKWLHLPTSFWMHKMGNGKKIRQFTMTGLLCYWWYAHVEFIKNL